jgi:hypothetical protein
MDSDCFPRPGVVTGTLQSYFVSPCRGRRAIRKILRFLSRARGKRPCNDLSAAVPPPSPRGRIAFIRLRRRPSAAVPTRCEDTVAASRLDCFRRIDCRGRKTHSFQPLFNFRKEGRFSTNRLAFRVHFHPWCACASSPFESNIRVCRGDETQCMLLSFPAIFLSTFSSLNIAQVGFRIEFSSLDPEYEYEAEADWALGPDQLLGGILRMSERVWPLDVAYSSRKEQAGGGNGIARGTTARAVASPHGGMLLEWSTFMASTGRGACETEELSLTVRLIRVDAHDSNDSISAGDDSSVVAAASSVSIRTFGLKCPGLDGELRSERIVQEYPPQGRAIDRESLQRTGYVARVDYLHDRALYVFHLAFGDYVKTLEVEVIGDQFLRFELPLLPAGSHNFSLAVEALDWGVVARHEHAVIVVDGGLDEDGVIGGGRRLSEGWILDREWCGRSEVNGMTCTNDGHRAEGAPFVSGAGKVGAGGGGDVDGGAGDDLGAAGGAPGDVPSRGDLCGKLHEAGVEKMAFVGDSFALYHYVSLVLLLTGDFVRGARKPGLHAPDYCNGWGQYSSGECRKLIHHEPGTVVALCGGNLVVRQGSKLRKTCISHICHAARSS